MKTIKTIGVIGAGTMGSALAQKFSQEKFKVILLDQNMQFVARGLENIRNTLSKGIEKKVFTKEQADQIISNIFGSTDLKMLRDCDLVVEAIIEDFEAKSALLRTISDIITPECIVATNTSSFLVTDLAKSVAHPGRFIGLHFFYHAAMNRLVEIIPGEQTSNATFLAMKRFTKMAGKDAIICNDSYGFAVNRYFVPWLNESVRLFEEKIAGKESIDSVAMNVFGIGMGPFALMNATGVPIAYHAEKTLEIFGNLYKTSELLKKQADSNTKWELKSESEIKNEKVIRDRLLGVTFFICSQMLDENVCTAAELNRGARIGLKWKKGPVEMMREMGPEEVKRLVSETAKRYHMAMPDSCSEHFWSMDTVSLEKSNDIAVLTMDQPENLNALSEDTVLQLLQKFSRADGNPMIKTIFITGSGKAFVAGADIKFFVKNIRSKKIREIETFTDFTQKVFNRIDTSQKKVVAVINGLTLGGGLELALCADILLALPGAQFAFPETGIGIYPGLGGTQRSAKRIGKGLTKYLIHTGKMISAKEAEEIGLVDKVISEEEAFKYMAGENKLPAFAAKAMPEHWKKLGQFFEENTLDNLLGKKFFNETIPLEEAERIVKSMSYKAPIALKIADRLIDEAKGCESELNHLEEVFATQDALKGLTSIGKKIEFEGK